MLPFILHSHQSTPGVQYSPFQLLWSENGVHTKDNENYYLSGMKCVQDNVILFLPSVREKVQSGSKLFNTGNRSTANFNAYICFTTMCLTKTTNQGRTAWLGKEFPYSCKTCYLWNAESMPCKYLFYECKRLRNSTSCLSDTVENLDFKSYCADIRLYLQST
jgi:hypothetical protein